jgi:phosphoglycolate phosphatase-like HAD superfamily hydrolase
MKNLIFDFDGTIVDSLDFVIEMYMSWYPEDQYLKTVDKDKLRNMPITQVIGELRVKPWKVPALIFRGRMEMNKNINQIDMVDGMKELLVHLSKDSINLYIASSNSSRNINKYLRNKNLRKIFKRVYGSVGIFSKGKALNKIIDKNRLKRQETYYVGDEVRDIKAAKKAGLKSIGVTWGYNGESIIARENPDFLVNDPREIIKIINS